MPNPPKRCFLTPMDTWVGRHQAYKQSIEGLHAFKVFHPANNPTARLAAYKSASKEMQGLIAELQAAGQHALADRVELQAPFHNITVAEY